MEIKCSLSTTLDSHFPLPKYFFSIDFSFVVKEVMNFYKTELYLSMVQFMLLYKNAQHSIFSINL